MHPVAGKNSCETARNHSPPRVRLVHLPGVYPIFSFFFFCFTARGLFAARNLYLFARPFNVHHGTRPIVCEKSTGKIKRSGRRVKSPSNRGEKPLISITIAPTSLRCFHEFVTKILPPLVKVPSLSKLSHITRSPFFTLSRPTCSFPALIVICTGNQLSNLEEPLGSRGLTRLRYVDCLD